MNYTLKDVFEGACIASGLTSNQMRGLDRARPIVRPRQIAMYLARQLTTRSLKQIGSHFRRRHGTVIHACRHIQGLMNEGNQGVAAAVREFRNVIEHRGSSLEAMKRLVLNDAALCGTRARAKVEGAPALDEQSPYDNIRLALDAAAYGRVPGAAAQDGRLSR